MDKKKCLILLGMIGLIVFLYIHRRVIKAAINGEPLPDSPHKCHCKRMQEDGNV